MAYQTGSLSRYSGKWYVRYRENGKQVARVLGSVADFPNERDIIPVRDEHMRKVNLAKNDAEIPAGISVLEFATTIYLPHVKEHLRESTHEGYADIAKLHLAPYPQAKLRIRDFRTADGYKLMRAVAQANPDFTTETFKRVKSFLSGVFKLATNLGLRDGENPIRSVILPKGLASRETYAYSLAEIRSILNSVPDLLSRALVAAAAYAGLREAELHGLDWSDYDGESIYVSRTVWKGHVNAPKSKASADYVPVIPQLRRIMDAYRASVGNPDSGIVFGVNLDDYGRTKVARELPANVTWHGWHAFRRGIASNLFELGIDDVTVQRILRHATVQITREHYIKVRDEKLEAAMEKLSKAIDAGETKGAQA